MSNENYGKCLYCKGKGFIVAKVFKPDVMTWERLDCTSCDGSGNARDGVAFMQKQADADWERERSDDSKWRWIR